VRYVVVNLKNVRAASNRAADRLEKSSRQSATGKKQF